MKDFKSAFPERCQEAKSGKSSLSSGRNFLKKCLGNILKAVGNWQLENECSKAIGKQK